VESSTTARSYFPVTFTSRIELSIIESCAVPGLQSPVLFRLQHKDVMRSSKKLRQIQDKTRQNRTKLGQ